MIVKKEGTDRVSLAMAGFTLMELLVVVVIIGMLAAVGVPRYTSWVLSGHLEEAKPYLMTIAAKERVYKAQRGSYYVPDSTNCTTATETCLENALGVNLKDAANFCFVVRTTNGDFISTTGNITTARPESLEVWAILNSRQASTTPVSISVDALPSVTCSLAINKRAPSGWVKTSGQVGGEGRVVVLRTPPSGDGLDSVVRSGRTDGLKLDWINGISITDPLL